MIGEAAMPRTRLVELPGCGTTRVWECAGPRGAQTLMLIHGVTFTAELNWAKTFAPLADHFRVVAADLRGHGDGIRAASRFRLEDCAAPGHQRELGRAVPGASVHEVDAGHGACITAPQLFAPALLQACWSVEPGRGTLRTPA